ncbi:unnamed protein product [Arctia plantaginis]|uniref:Uncharacterized protein n=1 Tax=Arctia plantaginis TaxID=874455 RepID=A0A8S0ZIZ6_ARCPL|nr:unnamed protein product [Arctia plantaginis]
MKRTGGGAAELASIVGFRLKISAGDGRARLRCLRSKFKGGNHFLNSACIIHPASKQHKQTTPACCENHGSDMERFSNIEDRRVEAEMTGAQALAKIAEALLSVGDALKEIARKMPEP